MYKIIIEPNISHIPNFIEHISKTEKDARDYIKDMILAYGSNKITWWITNVNLGLTYTNEK